MLDGAWTEYRRRLPHLRIAGATYFITWRLRASLPELQPDERTLVMSALLHFHAIRYDLIAFVVMNDHVHVVVAPREPWQLGAILHSWKSFTVTRFHRNGTRRGPVWQDESFDRILRDDAELAEKVAYVLGNPGKRWPTISDYLWVGCCSATSPE